MFAGEVIGLAVTRHQTLTRLSIRIESRETKGSRIRTRSRFRGILSVSLILGLDSEAGILLSALQQISY